MATKISELTSVTAPLDGDFIPIVTDTGGGVLGTRKITHANFIPDGSIETDKIAADAVDDTKVGNRVPQFYRRQGGSDTNWDTYGTTTYTPGAVRMQCGTSRWTDSVAQSGWKTVVFPTAFSYKPIILLTGLYNGGQFQISAMVSSISSTQFTYYWWANMDRTIQDIFWLAIGPE